MLLKMDVRTPVSTPSSVTSLVPWELDDDTVTNFLGVIIYVVSEGDLSSVIHVRLSHWEPKLMIPMSPHR